MQAVNDKTVTPEYKNRTEMRFFSPEYHKPARPIQPRKLVEAIMRRVLALKRPLKVKY